MSILLVLLMCMFLSCVFVFTLGAAFLWLINKYKLEKWHTHSDYTKLEDQRDQWARMYMISNEHVSDLLSKIERLRDEISENSKLVEALNNLSRYAASIRWKDGDNTQDWLDGLKEHILEAQKLIEAKFVLEGSSIQSHKTAEGKTAEEKEETIKLLDQIESFGCDCDIMNGYSCKIHDMIKQLRKKIILPKSQDSEP